MDPDAGRYRDVAWMRREPGQFYLKVGPGRLSGGILESTFNRVFMLWSPELARNPVAQIAVGVAQIGVGVAQKSVGLCPCRVLMIMEQLLNKNRVHSPRTNCAILCAPTGCLSRLCVAY